MKTTLLVFAGALALWGQCGPGQQLAPQAVKNKICINTPQVVVSAPVAVSGLPAASSQNANQILVVSDTANCTSTSGTTPMLCMSTGSAWVPVGGGGGTTTLRPTPEGWSPSTGWTNRWGGWLSIPCTRMWPLTIYSATRSRCCRSATRRAPIRPTMP